MVPERYRLFCAAAGVAEPALFFERCERLRALLEQENREYNLTRLTGEGAFWNLHVSDSVSLGRVYPEIQRDPLTLLDVGCGAGFPALVLAAAYPNLKVVALDSTGKKILFVQKAMETMGLNNLEATQGRAREIAGKPPWKGRFDWVTARAVAVPATLFLECRLFLKNGASLVAYHSGRNLEADLQEAKKRSEKQRFSWNVSPLFALPDGEQRCFVKATRDRIR